jgi:hypothetical protein
MDLPLVLWGYVTDLGTAGRRIATLNDRSLAQFHCSPTENVIVKFQSENVKI